MGILLYATRSHCGSTRALCHGTGSQLIADAVTDYYPFGTAHQYSDLNLNRYLFSGKELQDQTIGGKMLEMYDFGSRFYDPILGRWFGVDPQLQLVSPYGYCANNPVRFVDPNGEWMLDNVLGDYWLEAQRGDDYFGLQSFLSSQGVNDGYILSAIHTDLVRYITDQSDRGKEPSIVGFRYNLTANFPFQFDRGNSYGGGIPYFGSSGGGYGGSSSGFSDYMKFANDYRWGIDLFGNTTTAISGSKYSKSNLLFGGYWRGANGKYYNTNIVGNNVIYRNSLNMARNSGMVKYIGGAGKAFGIFGAGIQALSFYNDPTVKEGFDIGISVTSAFVWQIGAIYYGGQLFYNGMEKYTMNMINSGLTPGRDDMIIWK